MNDIADYVVYDHKLPHIGRCFEEKQSVGRSRGSLALLSTLGA
jgi:hypothetical protein